MRSNPDLEAAIARAGLAKVLTTKIPDAGVLEPAPKRNKYGARPTVHGGVRYDSKAEARRAEYLDSLAPAGIWYVRQPTFRLGCPENVYRADFLVVDGPRYGVHVEDVKGVVTPKFAHDMKLWASYGPCDLWVIGRGQAINVIHPRGTS